MKLNPILNKENVKKRRSNRKVRSDKKHDIKVYVSEENYTYLTDKASSLGISVTELVSNAVYVMLRRGYDYKTFKYEITEYMVHMRLTNQDYQTLCNYAVEWKTKNVRKAATNILNNIFFIRGV